LNEPKNLDALVNFKGEMRHSEAIARHRWHRRGCLCGVWHDDKIVAPVPGVKNCEGRPGCWCQEWHELGESGNKLGKIAAIKPFAKCLEDALKTVVTDTDGIRKTRLQKIVENLLCIAECRDPKRADSAIRALLLIADRVDGRAVPSAEALEATGVRVITVNHNVLTPPRPEPVKVLEPVFKQNILPGDVED
jgi:hypothetical protein